MLSRSIPVILTAVILALGLAAGSVSAQAPTSIFWSDISPSAIAPTGERVIQPVSLPHTQSRSAGDPFLPLAGPDGGNSRGRGPGGHRTAPAGRRIRSLRHRRVARSWRPSWARKYPEIRTYAGYGLDDPSATIRFDLVPQGFHALILSENGTIYIDPFQRGDDDPLPELLQAGSPFRRDSSAAAPSWTRTGWGRRSPPSWARAASAPARSCAPTAPPWRPPASTPPTTAAPSLSALPPSSPA